MKKRTIQIIAGFCLIALLLTGCSKQEVKRGAMGSEVWEEMPALTYGVLESDSLEVLPWNSGRCEASGDYFIAETELGYYLLCYSYLYYADKSNLSNWVPVCNRPDCKHWKSFDCPAKLRSTIYVKDDRIFNVDWIDGYLYPSDMSANGLMIASMAADGTDKRGEYAVEEAIKTAKLGTSVWYGSVLLPDCWLYLAGVLDKNGDLVNRMFCVTESGTEEIPLVPDRQQEGVLFFAEGLFGDDVFGCNLLDEKDVLDENGVAYYRLVEGKPVRVDVKESEMSGSYLSGNTLRVFRANDGYYDIDLTTREEVLLTPARLENSFAQILLPNCILEHTLYKIPGQKVREEGAEGTTHKMEMFDGETWRTVKMPEELVNAKATEYLYVLSATSDGIIVVCQDTADRYCMSIYRIPLGAEELAMEYCGEIVQSEHVAMG